MSEAAPADPLSHQIDLERYRLLPFPVKLDFDNWMADEGLLGRHITSFTLLEGAIEAVCWLYRNGTFIIDDAHQNVLTETKVFPISSPPPREALT